MSLFDIEIFGDRVFEEKLDLMAGRVLNARPAMRVIAGYLMEETDRRFQEQGPGWAPITRDWELRKMAHGWDPRILFQKSDLFRSVTKPGAKGQILITRTGGLTFGSSLPQAETMQKGSAAHNIPARPFLRVTLENRAVINKILSSHIMAPFRGGAGKIAPAYPGASVGRGAGGKFVSLRD